MSDQMALPIPPDELDDEVTEKTNSIFLYGDEGMARYMANNEEHDYLGEDDE